MKKMFFIMLLAAMVSFGTVSTITINSPESKTQLQAQVNATTPKLVMKQLINYLQGMLGGAKDGSIDIQMGGGDGVAANGYVSVLAAGNAGDTVTIAGVVLTAVSYASTATSAQFNVGSTVALTKASLNSTINANTTLARYVTSAVSGNSVIVTAIDKSYIGNFLTLAESTSSARFKVSASTLSGGVKPTANLYRFGY